MSFPPDDDDIGSGRPPKRAGSRKTKSVNRKRQYRKRSEGRIEMMTRILLKPVDITVSGERKRITTLEAIILQLRAKDLSDHPRASKVRLKYEEFARRNSQARPQIVFVDSDYTQALAAKAPKKKDDDHDL
jgi:hypothetical protein